jgi:outer membrane protein OmpA-like peptidoglycan-associated protein
MALHRDAEEGYVKVYMRPVPLEAGFLPPEPEEPPSPPLPPSESKTWFSLAVLDEVGAPVDGIGVAYSVAGERRVVTTDAAGVARLDGMDLRFATATLASISAVREKLKERWKRPRKPENLEGERVRFAELREEIYPVSLEAEKHAYLVLRPSFQCNEVAGAHFDFGRSFVFLSSFETLSPIAKALSDDGYERKAMIFGHTDLSGTEALGVPRRSTRC